MCSYVKSTPVKFWTRIYAIVGCIYRYSHFICDNNSGEKNGVSLRKSCVTLFHPLWGGFASNMNGNLLDKKSASALWAIQLPHLRQGEPRWEGRLVVTENLYARHALCKNFLRLTDSEQQLLGTLHATNFNADNQEQVKEAVGRVSHAPRGVWLLCQAMQKMREKNLDTEPVVASNDGYILWKDMNKVIFCCYLLEETPRSLISKPNVHAIWCLHGMMQHRQCMDRGSLYPITVDMPSGVLAYNIFINIVDRFDQLHRNLNFEF